MGLRGNNFHHQNTVVSMLVPTVVDDDPTILGSWIVEPWEKAAQLAIILTAGAMAATDAVTVALQGRRRDTGAAEALKEADGTTDLKFTLAATSDGGALDTGVLLGTLRLDTMDGETYDAVRITCDNAVAQNVTIAAVGVLCDQREHSTGQTDDLFSKQRPA